MGRLNVGDIPGYGEAVAREQQNREIAYLDVPFDVHGIKLRQMTPRMLAALFAHGSPFVCGSSVTLPDILQFLWGCAADYSTSRFARWRFFRRVGKIIAKVGIQPIVDELFDYIDTTFQDGPRGGKKSIPYTSQIAWMEFNMAGEPWRWSREQTLSTPLRVIYQQIRCSDMSEGVTPINPSDYVKQAYIDSLNAQTVNGNS
jgi:hypothetical protein